MLDADTPAANESAEELASIVLPDHEGNDVRVGEIWGQSDGPVALVWLRHYG